MHRIGPFLCVLALGLCAAGTAWAGDPGQDEVTLKSGGSIRGTVLVYEPGQSVKIDVLGEAEPRVVPWSDVDQVLKGKYGPAPVLSPPPVPGPPPPPPGPRLGDPGVVRVHLESPAPVTLVHEYTAAFPTTESHIDQLGNMVTRDVTGFATQRDPLCQAPCDQLISVSPLRIVGVGFPASSTFNLTHDSGDVTVHVQPGSNAEHYGGIVSIALGSVAAVAGGVIFPLNQALSTTTDANTGAKVNVPNPGLRDASIGLMVGGLAAVGGGIALVVLGGTKLTLSHGTASARGAVKPRYWMGEF